MSVAAPKIVTIKPKQTYTPAERDKVLKQLESTFGLKAHERNRKLERSQVKDSDRTLSIPPKFYAEAQHYKITHLFGLKLIP